MWFEKKGLRRGPRGGFFRFALVFCFLAAAVFAQSTDQANPTPVTANEISGAIPARGIGDSRLTNYFFTFNGNTGDVFINVVSTNLDGDIDIFTVEGLRPLTKIAIFSDVAENETGRVVYLRKFEKLLLRIQGRSPNDEPATFRIKFAGSFQPLESISGSADTTVPDVKTGETGGIRVNSVGAIIQPKKAPTPEPSVDALAAKKSNKQINITSVDGEESAENTTRIEISRTNPADPTTKAEIAVSPESDMIPNIQAKPLVIITEPALPENIAGVEPPSKTEAEITEPDVSNSEKEKETTETPGIVEPLSASQLVGIDLVIKFRDGTEIKRPLTKVFNFNVNQGILRVVTNDGTVYKYSMLDVEKVSIESNPKP